MKIVVIGGTGLIGSKTIALLRRAGHDAVAAAPDTGVNTVTGEGLDAALTGADVVIDLANLRSFEPDAVLDFFTKHEKNLLRAEARAGVRHHVVLSIVGTDRSPDNGYFRAKIAQEELIKQSGVPFTVVRSTQFMEFLGSIADAGQKGDAVSIASGLFQPIAADDVASAVARAAAGEPVGGRIEIAGPDRIRIDEAVRLAVPDADVVADASVGYFGADVDDSSLVAGEDARLGERRFADFAAAG
jgi:uncharacterized protein YbjT (DUF2867 family)